MQECITEIMKPRYQLLLTAITPLIIALCIVAFAVHHQARALEERQGDIIKNGYLAARESELQHYVGLAKRAITPLYESGKTDESTRNEAKAVLNGLLYGKDGYFFVYDREGNLLVEPNRPNLVGTNRWNHTDKDGYQNIQNFIRKAEAGGGFVKYKTEKPSTKETAPKLAYVIPLPRWGWILGTGIYLDDVDSVLGGIGGQVAKNNADMMRWIGSVAFFGITIIVFLSLILNLRERHAVKEAERARLASELHDSVCQRLTAIKLQVEAGNEMSALMPEPSITAQRLFEKTAADISDLTKEVKEIAHSLYPANLKGLGLAGALRELVSETENTRTKIGFSTYGVAHDLTEPENLALYRVAQESLMNVMRHANAKNAAVRLESNTRCTQVIISDDGIGFDVNGLNRTSHGMGLRNLRERMKEISGELDVASSNHGTTIIATVFPRSIT